MVKEGVAVDMVYDMMGLKVKELKDSVAGGLVVFFFFFGGCQVGDKAIVGAEGVGGITDTAFWAQDNSTAENAGGRDKAFRGVDAVSFEDFVDSLAGSSVAFGNGSHRGKVLVVVDD